MDTVSRKHPMPYGAELQDDGSVRFRLWAPAATRVDVCLAGGGPEPHTVLPMHAEPGGWFRLVTGHAAAGTRYRYRIDGGREVPDPASRFQPQDVHGPSEVIDPAAWAWRDSAWQGRPWEETVLYELHVGCFTPRGDFAATGEKLDHLTGLGVTALELMPVADFPGARNWGYDGTCLFAPDHRYGRPEDLKALVEAAHARGLMVLLDVVYNHFGPEGNYLHLYAPQFFTQRHRTPWGDAINFDAQSADPVRQFFIHNALYWLEEYHLDGLRLDAVHAIADDSRPDILIELAQRVRDHFPENRHIHLVLENDDNAAHYLERGPGNRPRWYAAQWNDDLHHALHALLTGETGGYYRDYAADPVRHLGRCLAEGFDYQGEASAYRGGNARGEPSAHLPATAFVTFLQNHDQTGNRARGERITTLAGPEPLRAALALLLLAPSPPLLFMGQEWGCTRPFAFFCDFAAETGAQVRAGRRRMFASLPEFRAPQALGELPDPQDPATFRRCILDWDACRQPAGQAWLTWHRELLVLRQRELVPRLRDLTARQTVCTPPGRRVLSARWVLGDDSVLFLLANLGEEPATGVTPPAYPVLYATHSDTRSMHTLPAWSVTWYLQPAGVAT